MQDSWHTWPGCQEQFLASHRHGLMENYRARGSLNGEVLPSLFNIIFQNVAERLNNHRRPCHFIE